jgi:hypothetical protein
MATKRLVDHLCVHCLDRLSSLVDRPAPSFRAHPEHAEQERREQRRVHEAENELQHVYDVVEPRGQVGCGDAEHDAGQRRALVANVATP